MRKMLLHAWAAVLFVACLYPADALAQAPDTAALRQQVLAVERAFARTMAERDHAAFSSFLAEDAIFFSERATLRGRQAVAEGWKPLFEGATAPFSWEPDHVEVLASGSLALSTGPVYSPSGQVVGRFNSIWRREASGEWRVVFDKGSPVCRSAAPGG